MKKLSTLFGCLLITLAAVHVDAQTSPDSFRTGAKTIRIPSPAGFVNGLPRIPQVAALVKAFEEPDGRTLTMHIPQSIASKVIAGERVESPLRQPTTPSAEAAATPPQTRRGAKPATPP